MTERQLLLLGRRVARFTMAERRAEGRREVERFPLTVEYVQRTCRRLGQPVGEHRARAIRRALLASRKLARVQEAPGCRVLVARADLDQLMQQWRR